MGIRETKHEIINVPLKHHHILPTVDKVPFYLFTKFFFKNQQTYKESLQDGLWNHRGIVCDIIAKRKS